MKDIEQAKKKEFIQRLYAQGTEYLHQSHAENIANSLDALSDDIYSDGQRFIFELIQNADDASKENMNEVRFTFLPNCLLVSHQGIAFSESDVESLTRIGASTKKADSKKTGYKGIGFKSVFGRSERVSIFSGGFQFRFDKKANRAGMPWQIIPIWTEFTDLPNEVAKLIQNDLSSVSTVIETNQLGQLASELGELIGNGQILLFLRNVSKLVLENGTETTSIERRVIRSTTAFTSISILKNGVEISAWATAKFPDINIPETTKEKLKHDEKTPQKLKDVSTTEIAFAARLEKGRIRSLRDDQSNVYTYLPTKVTDFKFPFLVNGSFITNASREGIHDDRIWNVWLFSLVAEKLAEWLALLANSEYKLQVLHLLPQRFAQSDNELKQAFDRSFNKHLPERRFISTKGGSVCTPVEVLFDKTGLSEQTFISKTSIVDFVSKSKNKKFKIDCFVDPEMDLTSKLKSIGVESFELDDFTQFFSSSSFTDSHTVDSNFALINYLFDKSQADASGEWFQGLKKLAFIYSDDEVLSNPENGICFPTGVADMELGKVPIIHHVVFKQIQPAKEIFEWLQKLGVKDPTEVAYVTNVLIPEIRNETFVTAENYLDVTSYLFRLHKKSLLDVETLAFLRELKLKTIGEAFVPASLCFLSDMYQPKLMLERLITGIPFVSEDYLQAGGSEAEWNVFFKAIGVKDRIEVETIKHNNALERVREITDATWVSESKALAAAGGGFGFGEHNVIDNIKIPSLLESTKSNHAFCKLFWDSLISSVRLDEMTAKATFRYGVGYGLNGYSRSVENYFPWFVRNQACIPTTTGEMLHGREVFYLGKELKSNAGNFLPIFDFDRPLPDDWKKFFQFKDALLLEDYLRILSELSKPRNGGKIVTPSSKLLGHIYNQLSGMVVDLTEDKKDLITSWAKANSLWANNESFVPTHGLSWVNIDGITIDPEKLTTIFVPAVCDKTAIEFQDLLSLLGVQKISEFVPHFETANLDESLKQKLETILPYFIAVIEKKGIEENGGEYNWLYSRIEETQFYTTQDIRLFLKTQSALIEGPSLAVYREELSFYFRGRWNSERTVMSLVRELNSWFVLRGVNEELRFLLLETDEAEIKAWLKEQGIRQDDIRPGRLFKRSESEISIAGTNINSQVTVVIDSAQDSSAKVTMNKGTQSTVSKPFEPAVKAEDTTLPSFIYRSNDTNEVNVQEDDAIQYNEISDEKVRIDIGFWSEKYVNRHLASLGNFTDIIWENEHGESGKPYDFTTNEHGQKKFIEVKGTPSPDKDLVYLSMAEWNLMNEQGENYILIRIYQAGSTEVYPYIVSNPRSKIDAGEIRVALSL